MHLKYPQAKKAQILRQVFKVSWSQEEKDQKKRGITFGGSSVGSGWSPILGRFLSSWWLLEEWHYITICWVFMGFSVLSFSLSFFVRYKVPIFHCRSRGRRYFAIYLPSLRLIWYYGATSQGRGAAATRVPEHSCRAEAICFGSRVLREICNTVWHTPFHCCLNVVAIIGLEV